MEACVTLATLTSEQTSCKADLASANNSDSAHGHGILGMLSFCMLKARGFNKGRYVIEKSLYTVHWWVQYSCFFSITNCHIITWKKVSQT